MAKLIVDGENLVLHMPLHQKVLSFHGDIRVPLTGVRSVRAVESPWMALRGRRMAGVALRGVAAMGTWIHGDRLFDFCVVRSQQKAVQLDLGTGRFARFLVSVPEPLDYEEEADRLARAAGIARSL